MTDPSIILAKSISKTSDPHSAIVTLPQHSKAVADSAELLVRMVGDLGLSAMGIENFKQELIRVLYFFGLLHDIGKISNLFQLLLRHKSVRQMLRHEVVSAMIVRHYFAEVLRRLSFTEDEIFSLQCAILGHHRKFFPGEKGWDAEEVSDMQIPLQKLWQDIRQLFPPHQQEVTDAVGKSFPPVITVSMDSDKQGWHAKTELILLQRSLSRYENRGVPEQRKRFIALAKTMSIVADVLGSAIPEDSRKREEIIRTAASTGLSPVQYRDLIENWAQRRGLPLPFTSRPFQEKAANSESLTTVMIAGCGSGKSVAAYMWAKKWSERREKDGLSATRLFFCLPTMGTATEQYKDYAMYSGVDAELVHSRSEIDLDLLISQLEDAEEQSASSDNREVVADAFRLWQSPLIVCTADTVLGLMVNARKSLYLFPAFFNSVFVFDEVHAMDSRLFGHLLMFLRHFPNIPVLLMSASLPASRVELLQQTRSGCLPEVIRDDSGRETLPRYRLYMDLSAEDIRAEIDKTVMSGGKILIVCNQVETAGEWYKRISEIYEGQNVRIDIYHSRYRYIDRSRKHREVIDAFKSNGKPVILIATQVAEMSLDLSADLLITELAPIPSLIQRFGRLNRKSEPDCPADPKPAIVVCPYQVYPYDKEELDDALSWCKLLIGLDRALSQEDLAQAFAQIETNAREKEDDGQQNADNSEWGSAERNAIFISGVWRTKVGKTRSDGYTMNVLLERDVKRYCAEHRQKPPLDWIRRHELPVAFKSGLSFKEYLSGIAVVPEDLLEYDYCPETGKGVGARWRER
jgi:CRISPR-associated endonuclease/helicase Cas3